MVSRGSLNEKEDTSGFSFPTPLYAPINHLSQDKVKSGAELITQEAGIQYSDYILYIDALKVSSFQTNF